MNDSEMKDFMQEVPRTYDIEKHLSEIKRHTGRLETNPNDVEARFKRGFLNLNLGLIAPAKEDFKELYDTGSEVVDNWYDMIKNAYVLYDFPTFRPPVVSKYDYDRLFKRMTGPAIFKVESDKIPQALLLYSLDYSDTLDSVAKGLLINTSLENFKSEAADAGEDSDIYYKYAVAKITFVLSKDAVDPDISIDLNWKEGFVVEKVLLKDVEPFYPDTIDKTERELFFQKLSGLETFEHTLIKTPKSMLIFNLVYQYPNYSRAQGLLFSITVDEYFDIAKGNPDPYLLEFIIIEYGGDIEGTKITITNSIENAEKQL